jgi:hypothetical protein
MRLLALAPLVLLAACSGSDTPVLSQSPLPTPVVTTEAPSPTAEPTTPAPTPTPVVTTPAPTSTRAVPAAPGDIDGDGQADTVKATATLVKVTLSGSGKVVTAPVHADSPAAPEVLGTDDVDLDGRAELFLKTVQGASTSFATPYRYDGKVLHEVQLAGSPAVLGFGGSTQHGDGFTCTPKGQIEVRSAVADGSGSTYTVTTTTYRLTVTDLVKVRSSSTKAAQGSPEVEASYALDCGAVGEGG